MTASFTDLIDYLTLTGWRRDSSGQSGSVWRREGWDKPLPVLDDLSREDYEWTSTVERIASAVETSPREVDEAIGRMYFDVQEFRAADDIYIKGSIPVEAGFTLFSSARAMIRAAAATARSHKARIGGNYGPAALRIAEKARFGHTIHGSYIVPLLMPLDRPQEPTSDTPLEFEGQGVAHPLVEPEERRTTRMLAQALAAIQHGIVEPAREPRGSVVNDLVATGVSREMVVAVEKIVGSEGVAVFEVNFDWAGAFTPPPGDLRQISFPHDSAEILRLAADKFVPSPRNPYETLSGQIIDLEDDPQAPGGRATIRTFRRGRQVRIDIPLTQAQTDEAHSWFSEHRHVVVAGIVKSAPGKTSWVEDARQFAPLDEVVLFSDLDDSKS
ncbi:hypothetical protein N8K70_09755 [Microbacterium betulae]|uniref:Uncharacterized protein n=1 Tax=Microbacterium betulae TaxID=2981139 RepID=A0AA97I5M1_9MICO|nr:hypothetical protein [Microbacterium sp. AB]WOF21677.1 hypothetical protein N8K70_09755 [Microbacterium sp. AB]